MGVNPVGKSTLSLESKDETTLKKKSWVSWDDIVGALSVYSGGIDDSILDISYCREKYHEKKE
ncbi:hypothetical protein HDV04_003524 [Boothiomyces sp. JEL0838]|nr:hypothetical protein HDV04_003524 [Boothiomyces sp. JEL0838]